ncbi:DUF3054 domain-containing protein [Microlunatus soli]|uniref:DUF3054 domain-containing protein n=1 Tax=Microlunatus soli TaxID=630515 RepID=UPI0018D4A2E6|nr:DUF3054 domain-containing protein [Microlunatus soli]
MRSWIAAGIDVVMVLLFAMVGRRSHSETDTVLGVLQTAWPFLVAAVVGSLIALLWHDAYGWRSALTVWLTTVVGGMLLRLASGDTAAWPFWIVAFITLGILIVGWRLIARSVLRVRASRHPDPAR